MSVPAELRYTKDHEWVRIEGDEVVIGITAHAQDQLGDVVFVELPEPGTSFELGDTFGTVESVHLVTDRDSGRPRGFGFVEMEDGGEEAIESLHQKDMGGRSLTVSEAKPRREDRGPRRDW